MICIFDTDRIEKWANFSGDYNPIHFEADAAAAVGSVGKIAHGMLVLMFVKQALSETMIASRQDGRALLCVKSWFRGPVPQNRRVTVGIDSRPADARYSVRGDDDGERYFQGSLTQASTFEDAVWPMIYPIEPQWLAEKWEYFLGSFPQMTSPWIFIDALLFSLFIEKHSESLLQGVIEKPAKVRFTVQTSQRLCFDPVALADLSPDDRLNLSYSYKQSNGLVDGNRVLSSVSLAAFSGDRQVLQSEIGLLLQK